MPTLTGKLFGALLSVLNLLVWGCWAYPRKECSADASKVITLVYLGEAGVVIIGSIISDLIFNTQSFFLLFKSLFYSNPGKVLAIVFGGFGIIWSDFFILSALDHIPTVIALPIPIGIMMGLGSTLDYIIQIHDNTFNKNGRFSNSISSLITFLAIFASILAVFCLGGAHYFRDSTHKGSEQRQQTNKKWIYIIVLAGLLGATWSPLVTFGASGTSGVANPLARLLLYILGQGLGLIFVLVFYSTKFYVSLGLNVSIDPIHKERQELSPFHSENQADNLLLHNHQEDGITSTENQDNNPLSVITLLHQTFSLSWKDLFFGLLSGGCLGLGYLFNFAACELIPSTIVFSIAACEPLATIFIGISPLYKEFDIEVSVPLLIRLRAYLCLSLSVILFLCAIVLLLVVSQ